MGKIIGWLLIVFGILISASSYYTCKVPYAGSSLVEYSVPCLSIQIVIGAILLIVGIILLVKK